MAKKKSTKKSVKETKIVITDEQLALIAKRLPNTSSNVYYIARDVLGLAEDVQIPPDLFERLEEHHKLFKCTECNIWQPTDSKSPFLTDVCEECETEMNDANNEYE